MHDDKCRVSCIICSYPNVCSCKASRLPTYLLTYAVCKVNASWVFSSSLHFTLLYSTQIHLPPAIHPPHNVIVIVHVHPSIHSCFPTAFSLEPCYQSHLRARRKGSARKLVAVQRCAVVPREREHGGTASAAMPARHEGVFEMSRSTKCWLCCRRLWCGL